MKSSVKKFIAVRKSRNAIKTGLPFARMSRVSNAKYLKQSRKSFGRKLAYKYAGSKTPVPLGI